MAKAKSNPVRVSLSEQKVPQVYIQKMGCWLASLTPKQAQQILERHIGGPKQLGPSLYLVDKSSSLHIDLDDKDAAICREQLPALIEQAKAKIKAYNSKTNGKPTSKKLRVVGAK